jgi:hypothetical protein
MEIESAVGREWNPQPHPHPDEHEKKEKKRSSSQAVAYAGVDIHAVVPPPMPPGSCGKISSQCPQCAAKINPICPLGKKSRKRMVGNKSGREQKIK